jgi:flagellar hook-associated protein 2
MSSTSSINSLLSSTTSSTSYDVSNILASAAGATTPGIDVTSAVAAAIYADRAPERIWAAEQTTLTTQATALTAIQTATTALSTDMSNLNTLTGTLAMRTVTSSDAADLSATAATGTVAGSHTVNVVSTAQTGAWYSDLETSATSAVPATSFTLTSGSGSATFSTGGTSGVSSLNDLAAAINAQTTTLGVNATVVSDSSGARLAILSNTSGAAADFSISSANYTGTSWTSSSIPAGATLAAGSLTISGSAGSATIQIADKESYATLASDINSTVPSLGVTATATSNSNGTYLSIVSSDGSTPFTLDQPSMGFSQAIQGADASLTVDGVPVTSASNRVTGAIPGVTLNLLGATTGAATLTVASDAAGVSTAINQFVTDYNTAVGLVNAQFQYSSSTGSEGILAADPTVRSLQSSLASALNYVSTSATGTTTTPTLASMGISVQTDGTLAVDSTALNSALVNNPTDVQNFFQGASLNGFAASVGTALDNFTNPANGAFVLDLQSISSSNTALTQQASDFESNYIAYQQTTLTAMYSQAEEALQALPTQMAQLSAELGNNSNNSSGG